MTNTCVLDSDGDGTRLTLLVDVTLVPAGMPGMEDMMKIQMKAGLDATMATARKAIEG